MIMSNQAAINSIQEARRDALVDYYLAYCIPTTPIEGSVPLSTRVKTPDDLYEYLLLDTQITAAVTTSWVAESISSVQLYINRCLGGYDPDVDNSLGSTMVLESKPGGFLYDWNDYNQVYSTWAGKERLQYYPSVYLDPSLRYNKTELFDALEETINQGRISSARVNEGFQQYMLGFETVAELDTLSAYQTEPLVGVQSSATLYFVGRSRNSPYTYFWRSCNLGIRNDDGELSGAAWAQWLKIDAPVDDAIGNYLSPCWCNGRLYLCWLSREENGVTGTNENTQPTYQYFVNLWLLREDGSWVSVRKVSCAHLDGTPDKAYARTLFSMRVNTSGETPELTLDNMSVALFAEVQEEQNYVVYQSADTAWERSPYPNFRNGRLYNPLITVSQNNKKNNTANQAPVSVLKPDTDYTFEHVLDVDRGDVYQASFRVSHIDSINLTCQTGGNFYDLPAANMVVLLTDLEHLLYNYNFTSPSEQVLVRTNASLMYVYSLSVRYYDFISEGRGSSDVFLMTSGGPTALYLESGDLALKKDGEILWTCPLTTSTAQYFTARLQSGIDSLLSYQTQTTLIEQDKTQAIDFNGSYGLYFWEIFFHASFLIADRYLNEQNYADSALWYQYIFTPSGYRNKDGQLETIEGAPRYWNVVPLQQDHTWNAAIPPTVDPDIIAMNDPMHYKMAIFLNTINMLIERGDSAYRQLQRDFLAQAKMYYLQASQMLGPRPQIDYNDSWPNPTVGAEAAEIVVADFDDPDAPAPTRLTQLLRAYVAEQNGNFLPPYNEDLLLYWDKLEVRFYNLRHNLSLDGQPLSLPLFAKPVSPSDLQRQHDTGNGAGGNSVLGVALVSQFRFVVLLEKARSSVSNAIQFGALLQNALERRDNENLTLMLQTQQQQIVNLTLDIQATNIASLQDGLLALQASLAGAKSRLAHYSGLYENWISSSEQDAMNLRAAAGSLNIAAQPFRSTAAGLEMVPNIFGLAVGGTKFGAAVEASAIVMQMTAMANEIGAQRLEISEQYRRRRDDWLIQRDNAQHEVSQTEAQIQSQQQQVIMAQKQLSVSQQEFANQQAVYNLQTTRFTGLELYNWMSGRLASLYYQLYDTALSLCLGSKNALAREIGPGRAGNLFTSPQWNDLYQGLLAGEGLLLELQKMENTYLQDDRRGLEIVKTVSLNAQISAGTSTDSFASMLATVLNGETIDSPVNGVTMAMVGTNKLTLTLNIATLALNTAYGRSGAVGRLKSISVTLPALLGPYQDVEATLAHSEGPYVALSRGLDDSGLFVVDFNDPKYLPFEGELSNEGNLTLTFFQVDGKQRELVESLVDVIYQIRYTLKDY
jgi:hypothetical protein